jgi:hypothetical protein
MCAGWVLAGRAAVSGPHDDRGTGRARPRPAQPRFHRSAGAAPCAGFTFGAQQRMQHRASLAWIVGATASTTPIDGPRQPAPELAGFPRKGVVNRTDALSRDDRIDSGDTLTGKRHRGRRTASRTATSTGPDARPGLGGLTPGAVSWSMRWRSAPCLLDAREDLSFNATSWSDSLLAETDRLPPSSRRWADFLCYGSCGSQLSNRAVGTYWSSLSLPLSLSLSTSLALRWLLASSRPSSASGSLATCSAGASGWAAGWAGALGVVGVGGGT